MVVKKEPWVAKQAGKMAQWGKAAWPAVKPMHVRKVATLGRNRK